MTQDLSREELDECIKEMVEYSQEGNPAIPYKVVVDEILQDKEHKRKVETFVRDFVSNKIYEKFNGWEMNIIDRSDKSFGWVVGFLMPDDMFEEEWSTTREEIDENISNAVLCSLVKRMNVYGRKKWEKVTSAFDEILMV